MKHMNTAAKNAWFHLFEKSGDPGTIEILETIDVGYISTVYVISVDAKNYAVKVYKKRFNGSKVCLEEKKLMQQACKSIPEAIPHVVLTSEHTENEFEREILVMEKCEGEPLSKDNFSPQIYEKLIRILLKLHKTEPDSLGEMKEIERIEKCREVMNRFLQVNHVIPMPKVNRLLDELKKYFLEKRDIFEIRNTLIHGDLWWDNILVNGNDITIIDWLEASRRDYCRDLSQLKLGTLDEILDERQSDIYFNKIIRAYGEEFNDNTVDLRLRYYLPMMYLEESFYLPFDYFPWELKYREDSDSFNSRLLHYFEKSVSYFHSFDE
jgi:thiamine kinase-like enzyme